MIFEQVTNQEEKDDAGQPATESRAVALYFMDEQECMGLLNEMKQMTQMADTDMRVLSTSLGRALRSAANTGSGLPTGQPVEPLNGKLQSPEGGSGTLRYKIVPSKREMFYASRCTGKERVGLFGDAPEVDAKLWLQDMPVISGQYAQRRFSRETRENRLLKTEKLKKKAEGPPTIAEQYSHMDGNMGIPVFSSPGLKRRPPAIQRLLRGKAAAEKRMETPLYFSYDDLVDAWNTMRKTSSKAGTTIPEKPPAVEVYNMYDVVSSLDKDQWKVGHRKKLLNARKTKVERVVSQIPFARRFYKMDPKRKPSGLERITFVPSSKAVHQKETISATGNGKARLRPMKAW